MRVRVETSEPWQVAADVVVVPVWAMGGAGDDPGRPLLDDSLQALDQRLAGELASLAAFGALPGRRYAAAITRAGELPAAHLLLVGAGDPARLDVEAVRHLAATAHRQLAGRNVRRVAVWLEPLASRLGGGPVAAAEAVTRGIVEGGYDPRTIYRDAVPRVPPVLEELILLVAAGDPAIQRAADRGLAIGEGTNLARDLTNRAANDLSPAALADEAMAIARRHGLWIDVIDPERATELGMGMFMAIGRGSANPPRMIVIRSGGPGETDRLGRHLALVGKGVCFDTGGISLKTPGRMDEMKMDKAGAGTVLAVVETVARLAPGTPLLALAPAVENMPGPHSTRPGDVVRALNGKQVDVLNTDAEGRLILGDALTYAERLGATHLVDVATLTGAASTTFGHLLTAVFASDDAFRDELFEAGRLAGERYWPMPLVDDYRPGLDSVYADIANLSSGSDLKLIHSALFLREFVTRPWAHLDIAGTAYLRKEEPWAPKGATGVGHATLVELALAGLDDR